MRHVFRYIWRGPLLLYTTFQSSRLHGGNHEWLIPTEICCFPPLYCDRWIEDVLELYGIEVKVSCFSNWASLVCNWNTIANTIYRYDRKSHHFLGVSMVLEKTPQQITIFVGHSIGIDILYIKRFIACHCIQYIKLNYESHVEFIDRNVYKIVSNQKMLHPVNW